jgi:hypothetical protein
MRGSGGEALAVGSGAEPEVGLEPAGEAALAWPAHPHAGRTSLRPAARAHRGTWPATQVELLPTELVLRESCGPLTNTISPVWMPLMKVYDEAFTNNNIYAAAATSIAIAAGIFVLSYSLLRLSNRHIFEGR